MIVVRDLYKSFGGHAVLEAVDLDIRSGESVVIIGRSGGGKSVLLKHLIGLLQPDSGEVLIDGENIVRMNERQLHARGPCAFRRASTRVGRSRPTGTNRAR